MTGCPHIWNRVPPDLPIKWTRIGGVRYILDAEDRGAFKPENRLYCSIEQAERLLADANKVQSNDVLFRRAVALTIRDLTAALAAHKEKA